MLRRALRPVPSRAEVSTGINEIVAALVHRTIPAAWRRVRRPSASRSPSTWSGSTIIFGSNVFSSTLVKHGKPAPDLFLYAADAMGFPPSRCVVVEDSVNGVKAARSAGMLALGSWAAPIARPTTATISPERAPIGSAAPRPSSGRPCPRLQASASRRVEPSPTAQARSMTAQRRPRSAAADPAPGRAGRRSAGRPAGAASNRARPACSAPTPPGARCRWRRGTGRISSSSSVRSIAMVQSRSRKRWIARSGPPSISAERRSSDARRRNWPRLGPNLLENLGHEAGQPHAVDHPSRLHERGGLLDEAGIGAAAGVHLHLELQFERRRLEHVQHLRQGRDGLVDGVAQANARQRIRGHVRHGTVPVRRSIQKRIVDHHDLAVAAEVEVELHGIDGELRRFCESRRGCSRPTDSWRRDGR